LEEIGKQGIKLVNEEGTKIIITPEDFQRFWSRVGEFTSSSVSGVHYGHYKAAIQCDISTQDPCPTAHSGRPEWNSARKLEYWTQVMLEKIAGVCLVEKLRAIQLYEADFNCYNQFVFGKAAMDSLNSIGYTPEELFSQKEAQVKMRSLTRLSWPTSHNKPATQ
jgi:hypothetical protein